MGKKRTKDGSFSNHIQNIVKNVFQNNTNLLQNILAQVKKRKRLFKKD